VTERERLGPMERGAPRAHDPSRARRGYARAMLALRRLLAILTVCLATSCTEAAGPTTFTPYEPAAGTPERIAYDQGLTRYLGATPPSAVVPGAVEGVTTENLNAYTLASLKELLVRVPAVDALQVRMPEGKLDAKTLTGFRNLVSLAKPPSPVTPK